MRIWRPAVVSGPASDEVSVESSPPQAILFVRFASTHTAAKATHTSWRFRNIEVGHLSGLCVGVPDVGTGPRGAVKVVLRVRRDVIGGVGFCPLIVFVTERVSRLI